MNHQRTFDLKRCTDAQGHLVGFDDFFVGGRRDGAGGQIIDGDARLIDLDTAREIEVLQRNARLYVRCYVRCDVRRKTHAHFVAFDGYTSRRVFRITPLCVAAHANLPLCGFKVGNQFGLISLKVQHDVGGLHVQRHGLTLRGKGVKFDIAV